MNSQSFTKGSKIFVASDINFTMGLIISGRVAITVGNHQIVLSPGDILLQPNGPETYVISKRATLIGVYNMNKGYAAFKQIHILAQNDEYAIVESNTKYGLSVYDYIVLNQEAVKVNQFIK